MPAAVTALTLPPSGPLDDDASSPRGAAAGAGSATATQGAPLATAPTPPAPADVHAIPAVTTQEALDIAAAVLHGRVTVPVFDAVFRVLSSAINDGYDAKRREAALRDESNALKQNLTQLLDENARGKAAAAAVGEELTDLQSRFEACGQECDARGNLLAQADLHAAALQRRVEDMEQQLQASYDAARTANDAYKVQRDAQARRIVDLEQQVAAAGVASLSPTRQETARQSLSTGRLA